MNAYDPVLVQATSALLAAAIANGDPGIISLALTPQYIRQTYEAFAGCGQPKEPEAPPAPEPAVPVKRSVSADAVTCLDCGLKFKSLKRHLNGTHGLTPDEYRQRWGLKPDHPIVAPNYSAARSQLAKDTGLGRKTGAAA